MKTLKLWYRRDGFVQFMLGNEWVNNRCGARYVFMFCWSILALSFMPLLDLLYRTFIQ